MYLYLVQHGEALAEVAAPGRPLSLTGRQQIQSIARQAYQADVKLAALYHSSKLRARQSAEILGDELGLDASERAGLGPKDDVQPVAEWLQGENGDLAVVGHLPFLDRLTSLLVVGDANRSIVSFSFGVLARLERVAAAEEAASWRLDWLIHP